MKTPAEYLAEYRTNNIVKEELPLVMVGLIEDASPSYTKGEGWHIVVTGRNYASLLLDAKLTDTYHNMSSSAIVKDIIHSKQVSHRANQKCNRSERVQHFVTDLHVLELFTCHLLILLELEISSRGIILK